MAGKHNARRGKSYGAGARKGSGLFGTRTRRSERRAGDRQSFFAPLKPSWQPKGGWAPQGAPGVFPGRPDAWGRPTGRAKVSTAHLQRSFPGRTYGTPRPNPWGGKGGRYGLFT